LGGKFECPVGLGCWDAVWTFLFVLKKFFPPVENPPTNVSFPYTPKKNSFFPRMVVFLFFFFPLFSPVFPKLGGVFDWSPKRGLCLFETLFFFLRLFPTRLLFPWVFFWFKQTPPLASPTPPFSNLFPRGCPNVMVFPLLAK